MNKIDIDVEVAKLGNNYRYEKMTQGDDVENMNDDELVEELKRLDEDRAKEKREKTDKLMTELDLGTKRPTEMKHNTRVHPPSEASKTSEAAIQLQSDAIRKCKGATATLMVL